MWVYVCVWPRFGLMCDRGHILDSCATGPTFCSDVRLGGETQVTLQTLTLIVMMIHTLKCGHACQNSHFDFVLWFCINACLRAHACIASCEATVWVCGQRFGLLCDGLICATGATFWTQVTLQTLTLIVIMVNSCATGTTTATFCCHVRQGPRFVVMCDRGHVLL